MKIAYFIIPLIFINLVACEQTVILTTPKKKPIPSHDKITTAAEGYFWNTLHQGHYQDITQAEKLLMESYLKNPNAPNVAAHLGFLHIWKITEHQRGSRANPLIPNEIILSKKFFSDAHELEPNNAIFEGFFGDTLLMEGMIFKDKREEIRGYFTLKKAIAKWPEFNFFTAGYPMSILLSTSSEFKNALQWQWKVMDLCAGRSINREQPEYPSGQITKNNLLKHEACEDTWIAPHNIEGFFMNMGDMLVKSGNWKIAISIYKNAKLAPNYSFWPYRKMLEKRIKNAHENVQYFQEPFSFEPKTTNPDRSIMFNSGYGCMTCHQER